MKGGNIIAHYITFDRNHHPTIEAYLETHGLIWKTVKMSDIKALHNEIKKSPSSMTDSEEMNYMKMNDDYGKHLVIVVSLPIEMDVFLSI